MGKVWAHCFWGFGWKQLAEPDLSLKSGEETLRKQVHKVCKAIFEGIIRKLAPFPSTWERRKRAFIKHWRENDAARLDEILSQHWPFPSGTGNPHYLSSIREFLKCECFLPVRDEPEKSVDLAKRMFHVGRTGNLRLLKTAKPAKLKPAR